jgi:hypothetical protein
MSHTLKVIAGGLALLGLCLVMGRLLGGPDSASSMATAARWFIPLWLVGAGVNMWIGVSKAGYSVAEEAPVFLVVFAVPVAVALLAAWRLSRG